VNNESRIDDLLDKWEDAREEGRSISVETLCRDCPELADEVRRQIREVDRVDKVFAIQSHQRSSRDDLAELPKTLGRYRLDEQIGEGGFGQVWKGFDPKLERNVAIKVLKPERSCSVLQVDRFLSEARKVARLRHKNIVTVHETDHDGKWYFMVTEWINGRDLAKRLSVSRLPLEESVRIVAKVADALQHAHDQGVIHRDVKPHNILLDRAGEPFITDFGIAVTESELLDDDSDTSGTPAYMAPEQASFVGPSVDPRTDVYSLGVVLYELLVGKVPHTATTLAMLRSSFQSKQIPSLSAENPDVSSELERVCLKAMAVDQNERWGSAKEFAVQLRRLVDNSAQSQQGAEAVRSTAMPPGSAAAHTQANTTTNKSSETKQQEETVLLKPRVFHTEKIFGCLLIGICTALIVTDWLFVWTAPFYAVPHLREAAKATSKAREVADMPNLEIRKLVRGDIEDRGFLYRLAYGWPVYAIGIVTSGLPLGWSLAWLVGARPNDSSVFAWLWQLVSTGQ
jgi:serine/threonine protein kinase